MSSQGTTGHGTLLSLRALGNAAVSTSAGELLGRAAVLVTTLLAARALAPSEFAAFVGFSAIAIFAAGLWDLGFSSLATREVAAGRARISTAIAAGLRARTRTSILWLIAFAAGTLILRTATPNTLPLIVLAAFAVGSVFAASSMFLLSVLRATLEFRKPSAALAAGRWLTTGLAGGGLLWVGDEHALLVVASSVATGEALTFGIAGALLWRLARRESVGPPETDTLTIRRAMPFAANGLLAAAYNRLDIVIVAALTSASQVAAYAPASRIQDVLYLVPSVMGLVAFPVMARTWSAPDGQAQMRRLITRFLAFGLALAIPATLLGTVFASDAIRLVLGPQYLDAVRPTQILIWFLPLAVVQAPLLAALAASGRAGDTTRVFAATFTVAIGLHVVLDPRGGAAGAATASLARDLVAVPLTLTFAVRAGLVSLPGTSGLNLRRVVRAARW